MFANWLRYLTQVSAILFTTALLTTSVLADEASMEITQDGKAIMTVKTVLGAKNGEKYKVTAKLKVDDNEVGKITAKIKSDEKKIVETRGSSQLSVSINQNELTVMYSNEAVKLETKKVGSIKISLLGETQDPQLVYSTSVKIEKGT